MDIEFQIRKYAYGILKRIYHDAKSVYSASFEALSPPNWYKSKICDFISKFSNRFKSSKNIYLINFSLS